MPQKDPVAKAAYWQKWYATHKEERAAYKKTLLDTRREQLAIQDAGDRAHVSRNEARIGEDDLYQLRRGIRAIIYLTNQGVFATF